MHSHIQILLYKCTRGFDIAFKKKKLKIPNGHTVLIALLVLLKDQTFPDFPVDPPQILYPVILTGTLE